MFMKIGKLMVTQPEYTKLNVASVIMERESMGVIMSTMVGGWDHLKPLPMPVKPYLKSKELSMSVSFVYLKVSSNMGDLNYLDFQTRGGQFCARRLFSEENNLLIKNMNLYLGF